MEVQEELIEQNQIEEESARFVKERALTTLSAAAFIISAAYGVLKIFDGSYPSAQATLIVIESCVGIFFSLLPALILKIFKIRLSFSVQLIITGFMLLAIVAGEAFEFYYKIFWWDGMLHVFSAFGIAYIAYCLTHFITRDSDLTRKFTFCIVGAVSVSLAMGMVWEVTEFTVDNICGTNMQKFMPETEPFFNGGNARETLEGNPGEFEEFFSKPEGYRYALMDTMTDLVYCLAGVALFAVLAVFTKRSSIYDDAFVKEHSPRRRGGREADGVA